jgi:hypothetical protein
VRGKAGSSRPQQGEDLEELPEAQPVRTILYREYHYICPDCGSKLVARHPECPPKGRFGKNVYIHHASQVPPAPSLGKNQPILERQGLKVSEPTVLSLLDRASTWLRPEYEKIVELVRSSDTAGTYPRRPRRECQRTRSTVVRISETKSK